MIESRIDEVWTRIENNQGQMFHTITGLEFSYQVMGNYLKTTRTDYNLSKQDFARAASMVPIPSPGAINNIVRGPAYIWAILHDQRISKGEW